MDYSYGGCEPQAHSPRYPGGNQRNNLYISILSYIVSVYIVTYTGLPSPLTFVFQEVKTSYMNPLSVRRIFYVLILIYPILLRISLRHDMQATT